MSLTWNSDIELVRLDGAVTAVNRMTGQAKTFLGVRAAILDTVHKYLCDVTEAEIGEVAGYLGQELEIPSADETAAALRDQGLLVNGPDTIGESGEISRWRLSPEGWEPPGDVDDERLPHRKVIAPVMVSAEVDRRIPHFRSELAAGGALLPIVYYRSGVLVGPLTLPYSTPCVKCAMDRQLASSGAPMNRARRAIHGSGSLPVEPVPAILEYALHCARREVNRLQSSPAECQLIGRILRLSESEIFSGYETVIQNPYCPLCGLLSREGRNGGA